MLGASPIWIMNSSDDTTPIRLLIAEDHAPTRNALRTLLEWRAFEVITVESGDEALQVLLSDKAPAIALLDWMLPGVSGVEVCKAVRENPNSYIYLIVITGREGEEDIAEALAAGADDFIRKPTGVAELLARVRNGQRTIQLERNLSARVSELENSLAKVSHLKRLLPICMYCKKVRNDSDYWQEIDAYITQHTDTDFTHGVCPNCMKDALLEIDGAKAK